MRPVLSSPVEAGRTAFECHICGCLIYLSMPALAPLLHGGYLCDVQPMVNGYRLHVRLCDG